MRKKYFSLKDVRSAKAESQRAYIKRKKEREKIKRQMRPYIEKTLDETNRDAAQTASLENK